MAELTVTTFATLDGVMQGPGGPTEDPSGGFERGGWLVPHFDAETGAVVSEIFARAGAFVLGRTTYDLMYSYWPQVTDPNDPVAAKLNTLPKFVASRTRTGFDWKGATHLKNVVDELPGLKQRTSGELQVHGSWGLVQTLIEHDLVDEYRILTFPVIVGAGKRLFNPGAFPTTLSLVKSVVTGSGVVASFYRRVGALQTGALEMPDGGSAGA